MSINADWYHKMQELKITLETVSDVMQDSEQLVHEWVKEYLDERSN